MAAPAPFVMPTFGIVVNKPGIEILPHRDPFLFVDNLISCDQTGAVGEYTYTFEKNEFFKGHFPDYPIVPGVVLVETMAQVAGAGVICSGIVGGNGKKVGFAFAGIENARFRKPVRPGDHLIVVAKNARIHKPLGIFETKGYVNGELVVEGTLKCMMNEK